MPCSSCGKRNRSIQPRQVSIMQPPEGDLVLVELKDGNTGDHPIVGAATRTNYQYRKDGERFYVARADADRMPSLSIVREEVEAEEEKEVETPAPPPPPFDLTTIWGINEDRAEKLRDMGVRSPRGITLLSVEKLSEIMPEATAKRVLEEANKLL